MASARRNRRRGKRGDPPDADKGGGFPRCGVLHRVHPDERQRRSDGRRGDAAGKPRAPCAERYGRDRPERSDAAGVYLVVLQPVGQKRRSTVHCPGQFRTADRTDREFRCRAERTADGIEYE